MTKEESPSTAKLVKRRQEVELNSEEMEGIMQDLWDSPSRRTPISRGSHGDFEPEECVLCQQNIHSDKFPQIIAKALFGKYCNSHRFYYTKEVSSIIANERDAASIQFWELDLLSTPEELMRRFYTSDEFTSKFQVLWRFHQFTKSRPGMFDKGTFDIICKNYYFKRKLHEKAIRRMLEKLSDSELEKGDIDLDKFMEDSHVFIERKGREHSRMLSERDMKPISGVKPLNIRDALLSAIKNSAGDYMPSVRRDSAMKQKSYQMSIKEGDGIKMMIQGKFEKVLMPSFIQGNSILQGSKKTENKDISGYFKRLNSASILEKKDSISAGPNNPKKKLNFDKIPMIRKESDHHSKFLSFEMDQDKDELKPQLENIRTSRLLGQTGSNKENTHPNISENPIEMIRKTSSNRGMIDEIGTEFLRKHKIKHILSKNSTHYYSKQSKTSGLSTREEETKAGVSKRDKENCQNESKSRLNATGISKEKEKSLRNLKGTTLKITLPNHDKLDFNTIKSTQLSIKSRPGELTGLLKKKGTKDKSKSKQKKINIADIQKFLNCQHQTPIDHAPQIFNRHSSKEKRTGSTSQKIDFKKRILDSKEKKSVSKEKKVGYFLAKNYKKHQSGASCNSGSGMNSRNNSKDKLSKSKFTKTASHLALKPNLIPTDKKLKTMSFLEAKISKNKIGHPNLMASQKVFEEKNFSMTLNITGSRKKLHLHLLPSTAHSQTLFQMPSTKTSINAEAPTTILFPKDYLKKNSKSTVKVSEMISPKGNSTLEKTANLSYQKQLSSKNNTLTRTQIFEGMSNFRKQSANKGTPCETNRVSHMGIPKPESKRKQSSSKQTHFEHPKHTHEFLKGSNSCSQDNVAFSSSTKDRGTKREESKGRLKRASREHKDGLSRTKNKSSSRLTSKHSLKYF